MKNFISALGLAAVLISGAQAASMCMNGGQDHHVMVNNQSHKIVTVMMYIQNPGGAGNHAPVMKQLNAGATGSYALSCLPLKANVWVVMRLTGTLIGTCKYAANNLSVMYKVQDKGNSIVCSQ